MISATCPNCTIYLVEANSDNVSDLEAAEVEAVALGAHIVSNGWHCRPLSCATPRDFDTPGVTYLAAWAEGYSPQLLAPEAFDTVAAIGGTQLAKTGTTYSETIATSAVGGCATGIKKPKWQAVIPDSVCASRIANDAAAEAGCLPGVAEYDSNEGGWFQLCGTSVSTPLVAGMFALAGNATQQRGGRTFWLRTHRKHLYSIGGTCSFNGYHRGKYNICTGWGSPNGIGAL